MRNKYSITSNPHRVALKSGETYAFCCCGKSDVQPMCDRYSHRGSAEKPIAFKVDLDAIYYICGCKKTRHAPYCDGSHKK
jgi:CDGSH-type Zn-finger protein